MSKHFRYLGTTKLPPHTHQFQKHTHPPKPHAHNNNNTPKTHAHNNNNNTYTYGTINGCSPHPPACVWVGWVLDLGGCFVITFIVCVVCFIVCVINAKYSGHFLHHTQYIQQLPSAFQFLLQDVFNVVVIVSVMQYYLIEAAL